MCKPYNLTDILNIPLDGKIKLYTPEEKVDWNKVVCESKSSTPIYDLYDSIEQLVKKEMEKW